MPPRKPSSHLQSLEGGRATPRKPRKSSDDIKNDLVAAVAQEVWSAIEGIYGLGPKFKERFEQRGQVRVTLYDAKSLPMEMAQYNDHSVAFAMQDILAIEPKNDALATNDVLQYGLRAVARLLLLKKRITDITDTEYVQTELDEGATDEEKEDKTGKAEPKKDVTPGVGLVYNQLFHKIDNFPKEIRVKKFEA